MGPATDRVGPIKKPLMSLQIDVVKVENNTAVCNLYTGDRCVRIIMIESDYGSLKRDGFFIRDGKTKDFAEVINTSREYHLKK